LITKNVSIVVGSLYGDCGKGKIVGYLALRDNPDIIARAGGPNCGHTVVYENKKYLLSMLPSGLINTRSRLLLGAGTLVDPRKFLAEIKKYDVAPGRIGIDRRATLISQNHIDEDSSSELSKQIGTTKCGVGPAQASRAYRTAKLVNSEFSLNSFLTDVPEECQKAKTILIEGSQGFYLSNLYSDDWPNATSKDTSASGICSDIGIGPRNVNHVILVIKSYSTRVGSGPLSFEIPFEEAQAKGLAEWGVVSGRKRRISEFLDFDKLRYSAAVNSADQIALTKIDTRFANNNNVTNYQDLTSEARQFIENIEKELNLPVTLIGTGSSNEAMVDRTKYYCK
jgi:adenylosuccinate synthase